MIRAAAWVIGIITAICLAYTPVSEATVALAVILAVCVIVATWETTPRKPVVSREHEKVDPLTWGMGPELSTLDRLDGVGNPNRTRKADQ